MGEMESECLFRAGHHAALECQTGKLRQTELQGQSQQGRSLVSEASPHSIVLAIPAQTCRGHPGHRGRERAVEPDTVGEQDGLVPVALGKESDLSEPQLLPLWERGTPFQAGRGEDQCGMRACLRDVC